MKPADAARRGALVGLARARSTFPTIEAFPDSIPEPVVKVRLPPCCARLKLRTLPSFIHRALCHDALVAPHFPYRYVPRGRANVPFVVAHPKSRQRLRLQFITTLRLPSPAYLLIHRSSTSVGIPPADIPAKPGTHPWNGLLSHWHRLRPAPFLL
jgi:hypothetical protein